MSGFVRKGRLPKMVVVDLDACVWSPEMFQLPSSPTVTELGPLGEHGDGVVALRCGKRGPKVELFPGALALLQELVLSEQWKDCKIAAASSSLEPTYSMACLEGLEVLPGVNLLSIFHHLAVGRSGELSPDKKTHFQKIHRESGMPFEEMLFFDDCIWGDNVGRVQSVFGVIGVRTPEGITTEKWEEGLALFASQRK